MLTIKNLTKHYTDDLKRTQKTVVKDLSLEFEASKTTAVMGHNGAGKTTLIRMILGLSFPTHGSILFEGHPISQQDRHRIGYLPEADHLNLQLTPREILKYHLRLFRPLHPDLKKTVEQTLEKTGLIEHADRKSNFLSKGQRRRIAWSQAMIHNPDLIILDEPFSGLDPQGREDMSHWILETKATGKTLLLCTHDTRLSHHLSDRMIIMRSGSCIWQSSHDQKPHYRIEIQKIPQGPLPAPLSHLQKGLTHIYTWQNADEAEKCLKMCRDQNIDILSFTTEKLPTDADQQKYFTPEGPQ